MKHVIELPLNIEMYKHNLGNMRKWFAGFEAAGGDIGFVKPDILRQLQVALDHAEAPGTAADVQQCMKSMRLSISQTTDALDEIEASFYSLREKLNVSQSD